VLRRWSISALVYEAPSRGSARLAGKARLPGE
jgi:hypothetical protein